MVYCEFGVSSSKPLPGGVPLAAVMEELESDASMAGHLAAARRALAPVIGEPADSFRALRLHAGLSQSKLADRAGTYQVYIAKVEAAILDPGTDMIARLAKALDVEPVVVFSAVRRQFESKATKNG